MKSKLLKSAPSLVLAVIAVLTVALTPVTGVAQGGAAPSMAPPAYGFQPPAPMIDPTTGLAITQSQPWKDPNWKDPEKVLPDVSYDGLPLAEVAKDLRKQFKDAFDVLIPNSWQNPYNPSATIDAGSIPIKMQLKNVTASEVFNAMNTVFEIENTPLRWELRLNGKRQMAVIRVLPELIAANQVPASVPTRRVFFVGDLVSSEAPGAMPIEKLLSTVEQIYEMSYGSSGGVLRFHKDAQLLIVTGTVDQIDFVQQTLVALRDKARLEYQVQAKATKAKARPDEPKTP